ncbi:MAG TPA: beta-ketoacyl-[acyl-carrier-protein] synthase family protein [Hypericibacter adhaerens]|uniref:beta-ketoacyl-[acyl-carrier-protein] synthase family protein n=1 Tax=Hypericibacter adhaerens TaxID=2602016 RepID=UPI002D1A90A4|nr:beta-ketoacyl-[acyl-carrier-protein] synthase family protein [Hypericibacter adhaerens]HWA42473.1 beta-ketoacyl-[acyl-carrier-protein] synthase family protein [Hypericibacter adhaerens]
MNRVVITGAGCISPLGPDLATTWAGMREGRSAIGTLEGLPLERMRITIGAQVRGFDPARHFHEKKLPLYDRFTQFALVAAREAVAQSGIAFAGDVARRCAVIVASGIGGQTTQDEGFQRLYAEKADRVPPLSVPRAMPSAATSHVTMEFGLRGPAFGVTSACASANHALALAFDMVRLGRVPAALVGGSEACMTFGTIKGWEALRVMSPDGCRPFCRDRRGMVLGEGSGMFLLEPLEAAQARGARPLAELVGAGMSADAGDIVAPSVDGAAAAIAGALADAGLAPERIGYINAHGTATPANDPAETKAIRQVFGRHAERLAVSSTKAVHGHALGAAGAIELVAVLGALREGVLPPTAGFTEADPDCDLDYVPNQARPAAIEAALSNSFAFGGLNCVLALKRFDS